MPNDALKVLIERHELLDEALGIDRDHFVSDWNGGHPFVDQFLGPELSEVTARTRGLRSQYVYFDEQPGTLEQVCALHVKLEGVTLTRENVLAGPGSSSLLAALSLWLLNRGHREVYYIPPLYYTLHYFLRLLKIRLRPVSGRQLFDEKSILNLPERQSVLLLCDPIWYAGKRLSLSTISVIRDWQQKTRSLVLIDGSFQYMQWDGTRVEHSSILDPELTLRLVSPAKSLAVPSFRFAYLLHPRRAHKDLLFLYENMVGAVNIVDLAFAQRALYVLGEAESNRPLTRFLHQTYRRLLEERWIATRIQPDSGYFVFAVPSLALPGQMAMDQDYFELRGYPDHVRINLMHAKRFFPPRPSTHNGGHPTTQR